MPTHPSTLRPIRLPPITCGSRFNQDGVFPLSSPATPPSIMPTTRRLLKEGVPLSASTVARLKAKWQAEREV